MKNKLLELAREAIKIGLKQDSIFNLDELISEYPEIEEKGATFVTLTMDDELRGCIGSITPQRSLYEDIIYNAQSAAFNDTRFNPVTNEEINNIRIEISILSEPKKLDYKDLEDLKNKLNPFEDGVILEYKDKRGIYLPQVWNDIPDEEAFLRSLCHKAELDESCLNEHPTISIYKVDKFSEKKKRIAGNKDLFYSGNCNELKKQFETYKNSTKVLGISPRAIVVPHAGYNYSGETAFMAYESLNRSNPKRVIVIGPSHHLAFKGISGSFQDEFETPCGNIEIDISFLEKLALSHPIQNIKELHKKEHSTETQMPFIKKFTDAKIIELIYGDIEVYTLEELFKDILADEENVIVVSTDLSHFHNLEIANIIDKNCMDGFIGGSFQNCEACGILGLRAITNVSKKLNLKRMILDYRTSFKETKDSESVVGYMSGIIYKNRFDF